MIFTDVSTFVGEYPFRGIRHTTPDWLLQQMDVLGIERSWVGHLPSILFRDPEPGNAALEKLLKQHRDRLFPVPTISPRLPHWEEELNWAAGIGAPAVRVYPTYQGIEPAGGEMRVMAAAAGAAGIPVLLTCQFEDVRQRHHLDTAGDLPAAAVRSLIRSDTEIHVLVTHASRAFVEEVHFGLTPGEAARVLWDISWIWGAPQNDLGHLFDTVGVNRFSFGTGMPLRIADAALAKLDLLGLSDEDRDRLLGENLASWCPSEVV